MSLVENIENIQAARAERVQVAIWQIHPDPSGLVMDPQGGLSGAERDRIATEQFRAGPTLLQDWTEIVISPDNRSRNDYLGNVYRTPERAWVLGPHVDPQVRSDMPGGYLLVARYPDGKRYVTYLPIYWRPLLAAGQEGIRIRWCSTQIPSATELDLIPPETPFWGTHRFTGMWLAGDNRGSWGYATESFGGLLSPRDVSENFRHFAGDQWFRPEGRSPIAGVPASGDLQASGVPLRQHRVEGVAVYVPDFSTLFGRGVMRGGTALRTLSELGSATARRILGIGSTLDLSWYPEGGISLPDTPPPLIRVPTGSDTPEPEVTYIPPPRDTYGSYGEDAEIIPEAGGEMPPEVGDGKSGVGAGLAVAGLAAAALFLGSKK
jgi:hypothetical protein